MKKTLLSLAILALSGCANPYLKPMPNIDTAKLRLVSVPSNNNAIYVPETKECITPKIESFMVQLGVKANLIRSLNRINIPAYDNNIRASHQNEVYIPANQKFSFQFNGVGISGFTPGQTESGSALYSWCRKIVSFTPEVNSNYEALYDYVKLPNGKKTCGVKLFEIVEESTDKYSKVEVEGYKVIENYCK